jgi:hypothetical protein
MVRGPGGRIRERASSAAWSGAGPDRCRALVEAWPADSMRVEPSCPLTTDQSCRGCDRRRRWRAIGGPDGLALRTDRCPRGVSRRSPCTFAVVIAFPSCSVVPVSRSGFGAAQRICARLRQAMAELVGVVCGRWRAVLRSLLTLSADPAPTGRIVAAPTPHVAGDARRFAQMGLSLLLGAGATLTLGRCSPELSRGGSLAAMVAARRRVSRSGCRRCTGSAASADLPSSSSTGCRATRARARCASATPRTSSSSSMCTASSSTCSGRACEPT